MHSPWGVIAHARKELGYTHFEIMWRVSWVNVVIGLADRPGFKKKGETVVRVEKGDIKKHRERFNNG